MTTGQKIQQFKDYYLGAALAAAAMAALLLYMAFRFLSPQKEPALRLAVFDTELSSERQEELEKAVREELGLPDNAEIRIDAGFTSSNTNEYARLSILAEEGMVDAVIAGDDVIAELAGFGYFKDLSRFLPEDMQEAYSERILNFAYNSDTAAGDAQQNGELPSGEYPFGMSLKGSSLWNLVTETSAVKPDDPVIGVIIETENDSNVYGLLRALMK